MSVNTREQTRRASYGRGVIEGLRMAGVTNPGDFMNANKLARIESGLNTMARKVLEAVPMQEAWTKAQIAVELRRLGCGAARDVLEGCLATLTDSGLVKEPQRGSFIRVAVRQITPTAPATPTTPEEPAVQTNIRPIAAAAANDAPAGTSGADTLTRLANLGALLRRAADECDAIALDVETRVQAAGQDGEKLRQLQALLKSIGV